MVARTKQEDSTKFDNLIKSLIIYQREKNGDEYLGILLKKRPLPSADSIIIGSWKGLMGYRPNNWVYY